MPNWHAVFCKPQMEAEAHENIRALGVPTWFPFRIVRRWLRHRFYRVREPYFPGYIFADFEAAPYGLDPVDGVETVLGECPIPDPVMELLFALADEDGRIDEPLFKPGDKLRTPVVGLIADFVAIDRRDRVLVQVPLFGSPRDCYLDRGFSRSVNG